MAAPAQAAPAPAANLPPIPGRGWAPADNVEFFHKYLEEGDVFKNLFLRNLNMRPFMDHWDATTAASMAYILYHVRLDINRHPLRKENVLTLVMAEFLAPGLPDDLFVNRRESVLTVRQLVGHLMANDNLLNQIGQDISRASYVAAATPDPRGGHPIPFTVNAIGAYGQPRLDDWADNLVNPIPDAQLPAIDVCIRILYFIATKAGGKYLVNGLDLLVNTLVAIAKRGTISERFREKISNGIRDEINKNIDVDIDCVRVFYNRFGSVIDDTTIEQVHRKGVDNVIPDALSRIHPDTDVSDSVGLPCVSVLNPFNVDIDRIDPWYDNLREKIIHSPDDYPQWKVEDNFVFKFVPNSIPMSSNLPEWKLLVPSPQTTAVIESCHSPPTSGHFGFYKTLARVQEFYYWPKMRRDVLKFIRSCLVCGAQKVSNTARIGFMGKEKKIDLPFQCLAIDLMGPFPRSKKGNKFLLVVEDWFSKYTLLYPLRSSKSTYIEKILENQILLVYGCPQILICDNGPQFVSKTFKTLCKSHEINIWHNAFYSPQCNFVERNNRTIGTAIRSYVNEHTEWDKELSKIQLAINTSKNEVTHFTPAYIVFGRNPPLSGKFYSDSEQLLDSKVELTPGDRLSYVSNLGNIVDIFADIKKRLHAAYQRNSKSYNLRKRDFTFKVGDKVWRKNYVLSNAGNQFSAKLAPKYILCTVHKKLSNLVYLLKNMDGTDGGRWHVKDLKIYMGVVADSSDTESDVSE